MIFVVWANECAQFFAEPNLPPNRAMAEIGVRRKTQGWPGGVSSDGSIRFSWHAKELTREAMAGAITTLVRTGQVGQVCRHTNGRITEYEHPVLRITVDSGNI